MPIDELYLSAPDCPSHSHSHSLDTPLATFSGYNSPFTLTEDIFKYQAIGDDLLMTDLCGDTTAGGAAGTGGGGGANAAAVTLESIDVSSDSRSSREKELEVQPGDNMFPTSSSMVDDSDSDSECNAE